MKYHEMTSDRIDRVKFRDLLHDHFDMSDDFFMDRGLSLLPSLLLLPLSLSYHSFFSLSLLSSNLLVFLSPVFRAFDKDSDSFLSQEEWVRGMSIFLRGSLEEKIECRFF